MLFRTLIIMSVLCGVFLTASSQTKPKPKATPKPRPTPLEVGPKAAPDLSVFGLKLGVSLGLETCKGIKVFTDKDYEVWKPRVADSVPCSEPTPYKHDDMTGAYLWVNFPLDSKPQIVKGWTVTATVIDGKLEGVAFETRGVSADSIVFDALKEKYGSPTSLAKSQVQNSLGTTFDRYAANWTFSNLRVAFVSVEGRSDRGLVNIDTLKGAEWRDKRSEAALKDKRPL